MVMKSSPDVEALLSRQARCPRRLLPADTLRYFSLDRQSEMSDGLARLSGGQPSVSCGGRVREVEDRFREWKFQHDLTCTIRPFEYSVQQARFGGFGFQQFPDHGAG